jgi:hypothetical protein
VHGEIASIESRRGDPLRLSDTKEEIRRKRPGSARLAERDQYGAALSHSVHQATRGSNSGTRRWTYEHEVNTIEQVGRRLRPCAPRARNEEHAAQVDPEFDHRYDTRVIDADDGRPVASCTCFADEAEGQAETAKTDRCFDDHRRTAT